MVFVKYSGDLVDSAHVAGRDTTAVDRTGQLGAQQRIAEAQMAFTSVDWTGLPPRRSRGQLPRRHFQGAGERLRERQREKNIS